MKRRKEGKKKFILDLEQAKPQNSVTNVHCWCSQHIPGLSSLRGEPKPFMKEIWMQRLVLSRHPFVWWLSRDFFTVSDQISFVLATGTWFVVTAEVQEPIPGRLRTFLLPVSAAQGWFVDCWLQKPLCWRCVVTEIIPQNREMPPAQTCPAAEFSCDFPYQLVHWIFTSGGLQ